MHYRQCKTLQRVSVVCYITDIRLSRMTLGANVVCYITNDSWAGSHVVPRILHWLLTEEVEKAPILWVHTYPTVSSRSRGRCVRNLVPIGSEMWICIRYRQTFIFLYIYIYIIVRTCISLSCGTCSCDWFARNKEFSLTASKSCLYVRKAQQYELLLQSVLYGLKCLRAVFIFCAI